MNKFMKDRDTYRDELKILKDAKDKIEKLREQQSILSKDTINRMGEQIRKLDDQLDETSDKLIRATADI